MKKTEEEYPYTTLPKNPFVPPRGAVCFVKILPSELLSLVFDLGTVKDDRNHDADKETNDSTGSSQTAVPGSATGLPLPVVVSCVCRHWHNVAYATPSLWTTIVVTPTSVLSRSLEPTSLTRSKNHPLDIYVQLRLDTNKPEQLNESFDSHLSVLFAILVHHIHRWRTVEFSVSWYTHVYRFLEAVSCPAPQLKTLKLVHYCDEDTMDEYDAFENPCMSEHPIIFGGSAPLLTTLTLSGVHLNWDQPWITSMSNVTDLHLAFHIEDVRPMWGQFTTILRGASAIKKLTVKHSGPWILDSDVPDEPIQLAQLTDLIVGFHYDDRAMDLFCRLHLPSLKHLDIDWRYDDYSVVVRELVNPTRPEGPQPGLLNGLESLTVRTLSCDEEEEWLEPLCGALENLTLLNIARSSVSAEFLHILGEPRGGGGVWLPRLGTLRVSTAHVGDVLSETVQNRRLMGAPLSELHIDKGGEAAEVDVAWLKEYVETVKFVSGELNREVN